MSVRTLRTGFYFLEVAIHRFTDSQMKEMPEAKPRKERRAVAFIHPVIQALALTISCLP
jgi:hypothetical protein